jgi:hypothetical protein
MSGKPADPAALWDYPLRAHITVDGADTPVVIGFPGWDDLGDWIASPGRAALGSVKSITLVWTTEESGRW